MRRVNTRVHVASHHVTFSFYLAVPVVDAPKHCECALTAVLPNLSRGQARGHQVCLHCTPLWLEPELNAGRASSPCSNEAMDKRKGNNSNPKGGPGNADDKKKAKNGTVKRRSAQLQPWAISVASGCRLRTRPQARTCGALGFGGFRAVPGSTSATDARGRKHGPAAIHSKCNTVAAVSAAWLLYRSGSQDGDPRRAEGDNGVRGCLPHGPLLAIAPVWPHTQLKRARFSSTTHARCA